MATWVRLLKRGLAVAVDDVVADAVAGVVAGVAVVVPLATGKDDAVPA